MNEIWKPIVGREEFYEISSFGRIKSFYPRTFGRPSSAPKPPKGEYIVEPRHLRGAGGYCVVCIGNNKLNLVHRLVAEAFIPNPYNKPQVNHKDGNKTNNRVENLEWMTNQENCSHAYKSGNVKMAAGDNSPHIKITDAEVILIRADPRNNSVIAEEYGVTRKHIANIKIYRDRITTTPKPD